MSIEGTALAPAGGAGGAAPMAPAQNTAPATTQENAGAGSTGTTTAPASTAGATGTTSLPAGDAWSATLDPSHKALVEKKGWKSPVDALKSYSELETAFSSRTATAPKSADEYNFEKPTDGTPWNDAFEKHMKGVFHKAGLSQDVASSILGGHVDFVKTAAAAAAQKSQEALEHSVAGAHTDLVKAWGVPNSPTYNRNMELMSRALRNLDPGLGAELKKLGAVATVDGKEMVANATLFKALAKAGEAMFAEDTLFGQNADVHGGNPFDAKTLDLSKQGEIVKNNPLKAKALIGALPPEQRKDYTYLLSTLK